MTVLFASTERRGELALIRFQFPPVNSLGHSMRVAVDAELDKALTDDVVRAVVLAGEGRGFCAGAQIPEFESGVITSQPTAHDIWARIEASKKPVIAAIHGYALGGGLEFAMACHYRVMAADAKLAAPEVRLGLLPGAGGTQRLPRAVGIERALEMMLSGDRFPAREFEGTRLVDRLVRGSGERTSLDEVIEAALAFAREKISMPALAVPTHLPRLRDLPIEFPDAASFFARRLDQLATTSPGLHAPPAITRCVQAAVRLPFDEGLRFERARFQELVTNQQSKALRAAFFAERAR